MNKITEIWNKVKNWFKTSNTFYAVSRYTVLALVVALVYFLFKVTTKEIETVYIIVLFEVLALLLSTLSNFFYTNIKFNKVLLDTDGDGKFSPEEKKAIISLMGKIFLAVHIMVGLSVYAIYLSRFAFN